MTGVRTLDWRLLLPPGDDAAAVLVDRRRQPLQSPRRVRRKLAGPGTVALYLTMPSALLVRRAVPLDHRHALRWYWREIFVPGRPLHIVVATLARAALAAGGDRLIAFAAPSFCAVTNPSGLVEPALAVAGAGSGRVWVIFGGYQDDASRVVFLGFGPGERRPSVVVKAAGPSAAAASLAEQDRLAELQRVLPASLAASLPTPMGSTEVDGTTVVTQTALPGSTLQRRASTLGRPARRKVADLRAAVRWLGGFNLATQRGTLVWTGDVADEVLLDPLRRLATTWAPDRSEVLLDGAVRVAGAALGCTIPLVEEHYDLAPVNVLIDGERVGVADWELDRRRSGDPGAGIAGRDLAFLLTRWYFAARRAGVAATEHACLVDLVTGGDDTLRRGVADARATYAHMLQLPRPALEVAELSVWVERARHHARRWADLGGGAPPHEVASSIECLTVLCQAAITRR